jgi:epoxyqueuosine reductase QueG
LADGSGEPAWASPLVGFASGADPVFAQFKEVVGPFHWTPSEAFSLAFPERDADPGSLAVVGWVLPQTERTKAANRAQTMYPAERWARSRIFGEAFNDALRRHVVDQLRDAGIPAVAPVLLPQWKSVKSEQFVYASTWSERHMAFASGLGTFGLCDGLITPLGKAIRVGSVVAQASIPATRRPYSDHQAYCLFLSRGTCGKCIDRCPVGALSAQGHDKRACSDHTGGTCREYVKREFGFEGYGCGLCQTGVPCESGIPPQLAS